jgi:protein-disulfide isomerase
MLLFRFFPVATMLAIIMSPAYAEDEILFRFNGSDYAESQLPARVRNQLYELELEHYQKKQQLLDAAVVDIYLQQEAMRTGQDQDALAKQLLAVEEPDEIDLEDFYETNKQRIQAPFEQVRERIRQFLIQQRQEQKRDTLLAEVKAGHPFELLLAPPQAPVIEIASDGFPSKGDADAEVVIVEFADYQCPHCKNATPVVEQMLEQYAGKVKLVFIDLPVINRNGLDSTALAEGGYCAGQQDKFWQYHDLAFEKQAELRPGAAVELAQQLGLDEAAFKDCLDAAGTKAWVANAKAEAQRIGVSGTPTFFVNGKRVPGGDLHSGLSEAIETALQSGGS